MPVIIRRNQKLKDQVGIQNDLTKIQRRRKGEDQEDEVCSYGCIIKYLTLYICV